MKYALALIVVLLLGVLVGQGIDISRTPEAVPAPTPGAVVREPIDDARAAVTTSRATVAPVPAPMDMPAVSTPANGLSLAIPVEGVSAADLTDTFTDARSEGRSHDAIDIMAAAGTPVLAVADGHVEKLFTSERGGLTLYQFEPGGRYAYYYAHLQRYAPGLKEKQLIRRGDVIGYVGSTGNASPDAPHLHFAIFELGPERRWWEGTALNPYPILVGTQRIAR
jgi:murein DD-endopeptidase MepM/ murein hydrolase activator NlpD